MPPLWTQADVASALTYKRHHLFLKWLLVTGVSLFAFGAAWSLGMPQRIYMSDVSYLSVVITLLYFSFTGHCAVRTYYISRQLLDAANVSQILYDGPARNLAISGQRVLIGNAVLPECALTSLIGEMLHMREAGRNVGEAGLEQNQLLDAYSQQLRGGQDIGWYIADIMIKLGLLGTGIGFVILLNAVTSVTNLDITSMKEVLVNMSGGMGVKLYTTICGLIAAIMLSLQYQLLDRGADDLIALMTKVIEVQVSPYIKAKASAA
jgi:hypothetical protein